MARAGGGGFRIGFASGIVGEGMFKGLVLNSGSLVLGGGDGGFGSSDGGVVSGVGGRVFTSRIGPNSTLTF